MRVHAHTRFCFFCVFTLLFHQCAHCHESTHHHHHHHSNGHEHDHEHAHNDHQIPRESYVDPVDHPEPHLEPRSQSEAAEQEQQFYIQQLFHRYGKQNQLDFRGFENLLLSLGLGEVRVVDLEHDGLGHDHVAHLDLLEVQEGRHSHSARHLHPYAKHSNYDHHHHSHTHPEASSCSPKATVEGGLPKQGGDDHDHGHDHHGHIQIITQNVEHDIDHAHNHEHSHDHHDAAPQHHNYEHEQDSIGHPHEHVHTSDQDQQAHDHTHEDNNLGQDQNTGLFQDHMVIDNHDQQLIKTQSHHHHKHSHFHNNHNYHTADVTDQNNPTQPTHIINAANLQPFTPSPHPYTMPKRTRKPPKGRVQRSRSKKPNTLDWNVSAVVGDGGSERDRGDHMHSYNESRKEKREVPEEMNNPNISSLTGHFEDIIHQHEECLNLTQLLHHYGLSPDSLISPAQFTYLCPALLYQIDSRVCIRHYHQVDIQEAPQLSEWIWAWGFLSITVISLLSLLGVVLVPILNQSCFKFLLTFLVALAVGTLSGDALLHLLPHSQGSHDHSHDQSHSEHKEEDVADFLTKFDGVWKGLSALAGIYLLFIIEHCIRMVKHYKDQGGRFCRRKKKDEDGKIGRKLSDHKLNRNSDAEWMHLKRLDDSSHSDTQMTELQPPDSPSKTPLAITDAEHSVTMEENGKRIKIKKHGHSHGLGHSHQGHCHSEKEMKDAGIASIAWMVIMGDGMHNFSDGLAIGAAFSANITGGISTSVAVFCHELPHELGDFAVLLKAGMTVKQAIVYNLLSALMAYFGMVIGTAVGQYTHNVTSWIFAITAGMFLYVALVDMLPEMLHGDSEDHKSSNLCHFVLQNVGMLTGFGIMLLIAIYEENIVLDLGF